MPLIRVNSQSNKKSMDWSPWAADLGDAFMCVSLIDVEFRGWQIA